MPRKLHPMFTAAETPCKGPDPFTGLRYPDWVGVDLAARKIHWRAQNEKTGYEHTTPLTDEAVLCL